MKKRLVNRATESERDLKKRLDDAVDELKKIEHFDYLIVNTEKDRASSELLAVYTAEKLRVNRQYDKVKVYKNINKGGL
jgi:guanylate kinase